MNRGKSLVTLFTALALFSSSLVGPTPSANPAAAESKQQPAGVDLVIEHFDYTGGSPVPIGEPIGDHIELAIRNSGTDDAGTFSVGYYVSSDANITTADTLLDGGRKFVEALSSGSTISLTLFSGAEIPSSVRSGPAYLGVIIDEADDVGETNEANNTETEAVVLGSSRTETFSFDIDQPHSVPFRLFNVLASGRIRATVQWEGDTTDLTATLTGRRRPSMPDPTAAYASVSGPSPLTLTYDVTSADVNRGVGWRLAIEDETGTHDAQGTVELTLPSDPALADDFEDERIRLRSGDIWPSSSLQSEFFSDLSATPKDGLHGLISLTQAPGCQDTQLLERNGFIRQSFLASRNSFGLIETGADPSAPGVAPLIRAVTPLEPEDKVDPHVLLGDYAHFVVRPESESEQNYVLNPDGSLSLSVFVAQDVSTGRATAILSTETVSFTAANDQLYRVRIDPDKVMSLAAHDEVEWIEAGEMPLLITNDVTRGVLNVNSVQSATITSTAPVSITYNGLTGKGVSAGVHDNGVDASHQDLNVVFDRPGGNPHGTHVAGTLAGKGNRSDKNNSAGNPNNGTPFQWRGMAPNAGIIDGGRPASAAGYLNRIQNDSLDLTNHSHILGLDGAYNANNLQTDQAIRGGTTSGGTQVPRRPVIFAAANNGSNSPQYGNVIGHYSLLNQLKNAVVVGGWSSVRNQLYVASSLGPAYDGRLKPDVIAPGVAIQSAGVRLNERKRVRFVGGTPTAGTYTLSFGGQSTPALAYSSTITTVQNALTSLSSIGANNVKVEGGSMPTTALDITFQNGLNYSDQPAMSVSGSGLNNGATVQVFTRWDGYQTDGYQVKSGTSMAAPAVSGIVALMLEAWQTTYADPLGTSIDESPPLPSTIRAILVQTANDIARPVEDANGNGTLDPGEDLDGDGVLDLGVRPNLPSSEIDRDSNPGNGNGGNGFVAAPTGPDYASGWGMSDAKAAVDLVQDARTESGNPVPNRIVQDAATQGETDEYDFVVDGPGNVRVTLAWDDMEAAVQNPATSQRLVNDLDLVLEAPDGSVFYPWQLGHTIVDGSGNPIPPANQTPGTNVNVQLAHTPSVTPSTPSDYIPQNIQTGNGGWVAGTGRDHLNNLEQVFVSVSPGQTGKIGHWKARVTGFNVRSGTQDYSLVGMPYPDRPDLVAFSDDKAGIPGFGTPFDVTWKGSNVGQIDTDADADPGTFEYKIWLSDDFFLDSGDVKLIDSNTDPSLSSLGPLVSDGTVSQTSSIVVSNSDADTLLGTSGVSFDSFIDTDPFILLELDSEEEILEHKETNVAPLQAARLTDVVLVMDRSGSMSGSIPVSAGSQTKLAVLKDSAKLFLDLMRKGADDRLGEVSFNETASIEFDDGAGGVTGFGPGTVGSAKSQVGGLTDGGQTDIRDGLSTGLGMIPTGNERRRVIIFFSDGKRTDGGDPTDASFLSQFGGKDVELYSVGFGTKGAGGYAGLDLDLLETLANTGENGFYHVTEEPTGLDKFFVNAVAGAVDSEIVVDPVREVAAGGTESVDVDLSSQASVVTFILTWDNPSANLELSLVGPGGTRITPANVTRFGEAVMRETASAYEIVTLHLPLTGGPEQEHGGTWQMEVSNPGSAAIEFSASSLVESTVNAEASQPPRPDADGFDPGDPVGLSMSIREKGGNPVTNGTVEVVPVEPVVGIGDLLASGAVTSGDLASVPHEIDGEDLSLRERMIIALQHKLGRNPIPRSEGTPFELTGGGGGDYSGSFTATGTPGPYSFTMHAEAQSEDCSPISRETIQTVGIRPKVDRGPSTVVVTSRGGDSHTVTVTPRGSNGHYIGPGHGDTIKIAPDDPSLVPAGDVQDQLDGSYTRSFTETAQVGVVRIAVTVMGVSLRSVYVDTGSPTPGSVTPVGGSSASPETVTVEASGGDISPVTGVNLVLNGSVTPLEVTGVGEEEGFISTTVPAGLTPGLYRLQFETRQGDGWSGLSADAAYRVVGEGQELPSEVEALDEGIDELLRSETQEGLNEAARGLLRRLHELEPDRNLTIESLGRAAEQLAGLLARQGGGVRGEALSALENALNLSMIDARFLPEPPVTTPQGQGIDLALGNGVAVSFQVVEGRGRTTLKVGPGPRAFRDEDRGEPHVTYDVSTTANLGPAPIEVAINYREGDFAEESELRIYHHEDGEWRDRTANLDTQGNRIVAEVEGLSRFVLATGEPLSTVYVPLVLKR